VKLLRVLQESVFHRVGDGRPVAIDVRLVAATNADLPAKIASGEFRADLYYRIASKELHVPPLRARPGDIALLARAFLRRSGGPRELSDAALAILASHAWPGNVRQLESTMRLAAIHAAADGCERIEPEHLDPRVRGAAPELPASPSLADELAAAERAIVARAMTMSKGNKREAARLLGWSINTLRDRLSRYGIDGPQSQA